MAAGPNEQRLRTYLTPARRWQVVRAKDQWQEGARRLAAVAEAVQLARPLARENLGNHTADAADRAFVAMHDKVLKREEQMREGAEALESAIAALRRAETVRNGFDAAGPVNQPAPPDWDEDEIRQIQQMKSHNARMSVYNQQVAAREEAAAAAIRDMDATNQRSAATMRKIQGERPDAPTQGGGAGGGSGGGGGAGATPGGSGGPGGGVRLTPAVDPQHDSPTTPGDAGDPGDAPADSPDAPLDPLRDDEAGSPQAAGGAAPSVGAGVSAGTSSSPAATTGSAGNLGGIAGAVGGGVAGGAIGMGGALRGGGAAAPAGAGRAIGSSSRSGATGALGRSGAAGSTPGRPGSGARGAGAGATGRGATGRGSGAAAGARGGKGGAGRGGAGGAGGRGGRRNQDEKKSQVDAMLDDQDWVDDEDAAPGLID